MNLLIDVYDLEKLVLKWGCVIDDTYYSNKLKWGNKDNFFRKLINSKTGYIEIFNGIDEANISFEYIERNDFKRTLIM